MKPRFKLQSPQTGTEYWVYVHAPNLSKERGPWPTMLFMDGDNQFSDAIAGYEKLRLEKSVPPLLLVSVGYGAGYGKEGNHRGRDYTPTHHAFEPSSGGASLFLAFLTDTLWPELRRRYPVHARIRGIGGHSLGSLLALYALFRKKPFFSSYLVSGPAIWWDDRSVLKQAKRLRARQTQIRGHLYLGIGGKDSESMRDDFSRLYTQLSEKPFQGLRVTSDLFPARRHENTEKDTFRAGLRALFG